MRLIPIAAALVGLACTSALAQPFAHEPGTGLSGPASAKASNVTGSDTQSPIAPHLPQPETGPNQGPRGYLRAADRALAMHHTGEAQQALEMAETRLLDRATPAYAANAPSQNQMVARVAEARRALGQGDVAGARAAIQAGLAGAPPGDEQGQY